MKLGWIFFRFTGLLRLNSKNHFIRPLWYSPRNESLLASFTSIIFCRYSHMWSWVGLANRVVQSKHTSYQRSRPVRGGTTGKSDCAEGLRQQKSGCWQSSVFDTFQAVHENFRKGIIIFLKNNELISFFYALHVRVFVL